MNENKNYIYYELCAWHHNFSNERDYQCHFNEEEYDKANQEFEKCKKNYPNINFTKTTTETLYHKKEEHVCKFTLTNEARLDGYGHGVHAIRVLRCECGNTKDGEKYAIIPIRQEEASKYDG